MDFFCDFQQIVTFLTSQFLTLCTSIRKKSAKYILSCYLGYKIVDNLKKKFLIWRGYPQCARFDNRNLNNDFFASTRLWNYSIKLRFKLRTNAKRFYLRTFLRKLIPATYLCPHLRSFTAF